MHTFTRCDNISRVDLTMQNLNSLHKLTIKNYLLFSNRMYMYSKNSSKFCFLIYFRKFRIFFFMNKFKIISRMILRSWCNFDLWQTCACVLFCFESEWLIKNRSVYFVQIRSDLSQNKNWSILMKYLYI